MEKKIPFFDLTLREEEKQAALEVIKSNWLTMGPKIKAFEEAFATQMLHSQTRAIAVANCTAALHLALNALGIQHGDEVICPSLTFVACANAILYTGAIPVFADICSETEWNIAPADIEAKITNHTKAILVVHYAGYPCRMQEILDTARQYDLAVVEDASHGPLAEWEGKKIGTIGDVGCFSFFSNKNMTTGEGGMVVTTRADVAEKIRLMRSHGMTSTSYERSNNHACGYDVTILGYNYRMDELRAALGLVQLKKLPNVMAQRKRLVRYYRDILKAAIPEIIIPFDRWDGNYGYHVCPILLPQGYTERNALMSQLSEHGIQTSIHYRPIHTFTAYAGFDVQLPNTDRIAPRILSLPLYPTLREEQIETVVTMLKSCLN